MKTLHFINGGLGKSIIFTSMLDKLNEKYGEKISVVCSHNEVLRHPKIDKIFTNHDYTALEGNKKKYSEFDEIICHDPYYSKYTYDDKTLKETWFDMYGLKFDNEQNDVVLSATSEKICKNFYNDKYLIVQLSGGQFFPPPDNTYNIGLFGYRNYDFNRSLKLINLLKINFPYKILNFSFSNEYVFSDILQYQGNFIGIQHILKNSVGFISIDSSLQHLAATKQVNKKGIVLWNSNITRPEKIGYNSNINLVYDDKGQIQIDEYEIAENIQKMISLNEK